MLDNCTLGAQPYIMKGNDTQKLWKNRELEAVKQASVIVVATQGRESLDNFNQSKMNTEKILIDEMELCERAIENVRTLRRALHVLVPILNALPSLRFCYYYPASASIIMSVETREDLGTVRALHKGVWNKNSPPSNDDPAENVRYEATVMGVLIDIRVSELPPSCQVVETEEIIPAHTVKIRRLVCNEPGRESANLPDKILSVETMPEELPAF